MKKQIKEYARRCGKTKGTPNAVDKHVGARIKELRHTAGMSQTELGNAMGVTFQQVQKIEKGINRIAAGRLYLAAKKLGVPISDLFPD